MKKLSELNAEELSDVLCEIVEPMGRLMDDEAVVECFGALADLIKESTTTMMFMLQCVRYASPVFLSEEHRKDTFAVIAGLKRTTVKAVSEQPGSELIMDVVSMIIGDGGLLKMFRGGKTKHAEAHPVDTVQVRSAT